MFDYFSSIGGLLIILRISSLVNLSVLAEESPKVIGLATFSLNDIK
jgi:hypothetical protein